MNILTITLVKHDTMMTPRRKASIGNYGEEPSTMVTTDGNLVPLWRFIFTKEVTHPICESGWTQVALVGLPQSENEAILLHHRRVARCPDLAKLRLFPNILPMLPILWIYP